MLLVVRFSTSKGSTSTPKSGHEREVPIAEPLLALLKEAGPKQGRSEVQAGAAGEHERRSDARSVGFE